MWPIHRKEKDIDRNCPRGRLVTGYWHPEFSIIIKTSLLITRVLLEIPYFLLVLHCIMNTINILPIS